MKTIKIFIHDERKQTPGKICKYAKEMLGSSANDNSRLKKKVFNDFRRVGPASMKIDLEEIEVSEDIKCGGERL